MAGLDDLLGNFDREFGTAQRSPPPLTPTNQNTFHRILGGLGDSLLVGGGGKPYYTPEIESQKIGAAMGRMASDPEGSLAEIARLDPVMADKLRQQMIANQLAASKQADDHANSVATTRGKSLENMNSGQDLAMRIMQASIRRGDPRTWTAGRQAAMRTMEASGQTLPFDIPETMPVGPDGKPDMDAINSIFRSGMESKDAINANVQQQNADTSRMNAETSGRNADTADYNASTSRGKLAQDRVLAERKLRMEAAKVRATSGVAAANTGVAAANVHERATHPTSRGGGMSTPSIAPPSSHPPRFKGDTIGSGNNKFFSPDGKTWKRQ